MLYACDNVRTVTYGAKLNTPPMKAFRAPGFVEGTFGLECLIDELAARLDVDPLELRRRNYADSNNGTPYSSKNLAECYVLAEKHWERRHEVRARSDATWKHGVGMASQIWYGGGGPPSYAWARVGSDARVAIVTAMQDIGTGTRTAMAQIAAEELGLPLESVDVVLGDSARGPYATDLGRLLDDALDGPGRARGGRRREAADPRDRGAALRARARRRSTIRDGAVVGEGLSVPVEEVVGLLQTGQILGKGARGPNPAGMTVLTFGVQVAEVAVDVETGEVRVLRVAAIHDVGRIVNPLGAESQVEGGIIQGVGHTLSEQRLLDPETGRVLTTSLDAYRMPTIADVPEIVCEFVDRPDEHLTSLGSKGLGEPPIIPVAAAIANAIRDATGADVHELPISREEMLRALEAGRERGAAWSSCGRLASRSSRGGLFVHGGTEVVPLLRDGLAAGGAAGRRPRGRAARGAGRRRRRGDDARRARGDTDVPDALREACRLAASPQLRNMGSVGGNLLQSTRCWYWRLAYPCRLHGGDRCHAREGEHREHAIFANEFCASAHPSDVAAALVALGARAADDRARAARWRSCTGCRTRATGGRRRSRTGELILELDAPAGRGERLPEGDGPAALVVPAGRCGRRAPRRGRDAVRARRRGAGPVAHRRRRRARRGDAAAAHRVEDPVARALVGRALRRARPPCLGATSRP